ncbi:MAG: trypsin-like peptidase domain-containing protein [Lentisphaeria bacterium]|nr:trypsin-like peptidase domain-containing protein [Lentisphaeria bacterium]
MNIKQIFITVLACGIALTLAAAGPVARSVCLLKSPQGAGSGFFTSLHEMDVLVTNNHVILEMPDVKIRDINGNIYEYNKIYSSPERDLAIIPITRTNHAAIPNLSIMKRPDMLQPNTAVTVYGDSLGDGVIVASKGKYLGIGPEILEVNAPFVSGNSGGPILENQSGRVIGVATFCKIMQSTLQTAYGSRFEARKYRPAIRRFATRIDNISIEDFEELTPEKVRQDQQNIQEINQILHEITALLENASSRNKLIEQLKIILQKWSGQFPDKWHSSYMKKEAEKKREILQKLRNMFSDESVPAKITAADSKILDSWRKSLPHIKFRRTQTMMQECIFCKGIGRVSTIIKSNDPKKMNSIKIEDCSICRKSGKNTVRLPGVYAILPMDFYQDLIKIITPEELTFCGFQVGSTEPQMYHFYKDARSIRHGVFTIFRAAGNHQMPNATETRLWFIGALLMRVDVYLPSTDEQQKSLLEKNFRQEYPGLTQAQFQFQTWNKFNRSDLPPAQNPNAAAEYIQRFRAANIQDPFGIYYTDALLTKAPHQKGRLNNNALAAPLKFTEISFRHLHFADCQRLIHIQKKKSFAAQESSVNAKRHSRGLRNQTLNR